LGGSNAEYLRERRARLKAQGLCIRCGKRPAEAGKTRCRECADREQAKENKRKGRITVKEVLKECQPGYHCLKCSLKDCLCPHSKFRGATYEERLMLSGWVKDE
jgi:hypothetical protein